LFRAIFNSLSDSSTPTTKTQNINSSCMYECSQAANRQLATTTMIIRVLLIVSFCISQLTLTQGISFHPAFARCNGVSLHFPQTWQRRLFSSVPYRAWALSNITFTLQLEFVLLVGPSTSGKSTLLNLLAKQATPTLGSVETSTAQPVVLECKPDSYNRQTNMKLATELCCKLKKPMTETKILALIQDLSTVLGLSDNHLQQKRQDLTPSNNLKLQVLLASLQSVLLATDTEHNGESNITTTTSTTTSNHNSLDSLVVSAPILLLDEWLDKETSTVIRIVQESLERLVKERGALICCVTHRPDRFAAGTKRLQLSAGELVL
jgi:ABC-type iron transport system FetAB ATPase subunit